MSINRTVTYALAAVGYIADNYQDGWIKAATVSKEYDIPMEYLLRIFQHLVRANVVISKKGPRGGFSLARDPKEISMLQIIEATDGLLTKALTLAEQTQSEDFSLKMEKICRKATEQEMKIYDKAKLSDMV